jgi:hypothetical protein
MVVPLDGATLAGRERARNRWPLRGVSANLPPVDRRVEPLSEARRPTHVLHIGKTGGSALRHALEPLLEQYRLKLRSHATTLRDIPESDGVAFFVRDPVTRFVSAFNSRLREGRPRYHYAWKDGERIAFGKFPTANRLAEALSSADPSERAAANDAMTAIQHLRTPLGHWLGDPIYVESRRASIVFLGFQDALDADFEALKRALGLPADLALSHDPIVAHATPAGFDTALSDGATRNIREWYASDVELIEFLRAFRETLEIPSP